MESRKPLIFILLKHDNSFQWTGAKLFSPSALPGAALIPPAPTCLETSPPNNHRVHQEECLELECLDSTGTHPNLKTTVLKT